MHCIDQSKRCNNAKNCKDKSDEANCTILHVPEEYLKTKPPVPEMGKNLPHL